MDNGRVDIPGSRMLTKVNDADEIISGRLVCQVNSPSRLSGNIGLAAFELDQEVETVIH